jgi:hypothetical protein
MKQQNVAAKRLDLQVKNPQDKVEQFESALGIEELLPAEVVELIMLNVGELGWPCCEFVCWRWKQILNSWWKKHLSPLEFMNRLALHGWLSVIQ